MQREYSRPQNRRAPAEAKAGTGMVGAGIAQTEWPRLRVQGVQEAGCESSSLPGWEDFSFTLRHLFHLERKENKFLFCFVLSRKTVHDKIYHCMHFLLVGFFLNFRKFR